MANLRGSTFNKQIKNAYFKILKLGEKRHLKTDNFTHSLEVLKKRKMYLNDFKNFLENKGIKEGKINKYFEEQNIKDFLKERTINLSPKSALDYVTGFNSLMKGMEQANITIPINLNQDFLKKIREDFTHKSKEINFEKNRYIKNLDVKLNNIKKINYNSYVISKLQAQTGLRVQEALEVAKNFNKYYHKDTNTLNHIVGKGNHEYAPKPISQELIKEIKEMDKTPSYGTYSKNLKQVGINKSHNFRITFAKDSLMRKLEKGITYKKALKEVSKEINHHREQITEYYLKRV
jgi:hypothetical protein